MISLPGAYLSIANKVSSVFGAPYFDGFVIDQVGAVYDDGGSITTPATVTKRSCRVQIDDATEYMRAQEGFADGDMVFIILSASLNGTMDTDAVVNIPDGPYSGTWQVSQIGRDPASIGYSGKGRRG